MRTLFVVIEIDNQDYQLELHLIQQTFSIKFAAYCQSHELLMWHSPVPCFLCLNNIWQWTNHVLQLHSPESTASRQWNQSVVLDQ